MKKLPDLDSILKASKRIEKYIHRTPVLTSENIDQLTNSRLFFKCENFQKAGAFKSRGALNAVFSLTVEELNRGVCTHSSGNHAAALARAAGLRNTKAFIVMPNNSSKVKINAVKHYGGEITFCESNLQSRESSLLKIKEKTNALEIHPYNDYRIIAGQATAARELFEQAGFLDIIMAPVGGGGLMSGTALVTHYMSPEILIFGAEPKGADDAFRSLVEGKLIPSVNPKTIADGLLTSLGSLTFPIIQEYVDRIYTVTETGILKAMKLVWERMKMIIEPSSAVPLAAVLEYPEDFRNKRVGIIISGGNVDLDKIPWLT
ncbi:MAG: pyridoxal-phosphate dependent enzyme [Bacteroidales bacterium]|nr:pyridoxal-phosphate dependent enzyme [Bacteroidales bacterium]